MDQSGAAQRLVIVDSDPDLRALTRVNLELDSSVEVVGEASNSADGLELIKRLEPDVAIIDLLEPEVDGTGLLRQLRQGGATLRIVAYSADVRGLRDAMAAGADAAVPKSGRFGDLLEAVTGDPKPPF